MTNIRLGLGPLEILTAMTPITEKAQLCTIQNNIVVKFWIGFIPQTTLNGRCFCQDNVTDATHG